MWSALRQRRSQAGRSWHATNLVDQGHAVAVRPGDVPACPETENIRTVYASGPVHGPGETGSRQVPFRAAVGEGDGALWHSAAALRGPVSATLHDEHGVASARIPACAAIVAWAVSVALIRAICACRLVRGASQLDRRCQRAGASKRSSPRDEVTEARPGRAVLHKRPSGAWS